MPEYRELLLGCGHSRLKELHVNGNPEPQPWHDLTTLDGNPDTRPDVLWDLRQRAPLPFDNDTFDEIHCYEVLEHIGSQGDFELFFAQFSDYWRILKPGGKFCASVPAPGSPWVWGDPGHSRTILPHTLVFLHQPSYAAQVGVTRMSDYRHWFRADFDIIGIDPQPDKDRFFFGLIAVKPSRVSI